MNKLNEYNKEVRCDALHVIYSVDSGGKVWRTMLPWYDMKAKLICRLWGRWGRLNGFLHTQPVQCCPDRVLFISSCSHFSLIRHLPASGVFIIYRKLITYTRLRGSLLLHWLLLQKQPHTMGPWARAWDYWFSQELTDLIAAKMYSNLPTVCSIFSFPVLFSHICRVKLKPASLEWSQTAQLQKCGFVP